MIHPPDPAQIAQGILDQLTNCCSKVHMKPCHRGKNRRANFQKIATALHTVERETWEKVERETWEAAITELLKRKARNGLIGADGAIAEFRRRAQGGTDG